MTSRVAAAIDAAHAEGRGAFVGYLPLGFPDLQTSIDAAVALAENGADILELGPPYSDPVMDGTVIQEATAGRPRRRLPAARHLHRRARDHAPRRRAGARHDVLEPRAAVRRRPLRRRPARRRGSGPHHARHHPRGRRGLDRREHAHRARPRLPRRADLDRRAARAHRAAAPPGFVYTVSTMGITGERAQLDAAARTLVARLRARTAPSTRASASASPTPSRSPGVLEYADGAIVGTALVRALRDGGRRGPRRDRAGPRRRARRAARTRLLTVGSPPASPPARTRSPMITRRRERRRQHPEPVDQLLRRSALCAIHFYALCIIAGIIVAMLLTNAPPHQARRRAVGRHRHRAARRAARDHRAPASTTCVTHWGFYFGEGAEPAVGALHLGGRHRDLRRPHRRRDRRLARLPVDRHPLLDLRRCARPRAPARAGDRPLRQLVQPGAVRPADGRAVGSRDRQRRTPPSRPASPEGTLFHPTFLYEVLWNALGVARAPVGRAAGSALQWGRLFALYLIWYSAGRIVWESIRIDPSEIFLGLRTNVWAAIFGVILGLVIFFVQKRRHPGSRAVALRARPRVEAAGSSGHCTIAEHRRLRRRQRTPDVRGRRGTATSTAAAK